MIVFLTNALSVAKRSRRILLLPMMGSLLEMMDKREAFHQFSGA